MGKLDKSCLKDDDLIFIENSLDLDVEYICLVDIHTPDKYEHVYIRSSLKLLL